MDKLQLYITMRHGDLRHLTDINGDELTRQKVIDITHALEEVTYDPNDKNIIYALRSTDLGVFIIIIRTIPSTPGDHLAAWIFVPSAISVGDTDVNNIVEEVVKVVSCPSITTEHMTRLKALFERDYPVQPNAPATLENRGEPYAHRYYGQSTGNYLSDLIGSKRYQTAYLPYAGVILADKERYPEISGPNLTDDPLEPMVRIFPPKGADPRYTPMIFGEVFDKPFLVPLMGTIEVVWKSQSDVDVRQSIMVSRPDMTPEPVAVAVPKPEPKPEPATVSAPTQETEETQQPDTPNDGHKTETKFFGPGNDRQKVYNFVIPSKSADISGMIKFSISTRTALNDSPIDGYELTGEIQEGPSRSNHLIYVPANSLQNNAFWALGGFIIGILLALVCTCKGGSGSSDSSTEGDVPGTTAVGDTTAVDTTKATAQPLPVDLSLEAAVKYLDTNTKWDKEDMEKYPDLKGLFNDLNTINRTRIIEHWGPKLKDSRRFATLVEHVRLGKRKTPRLPEGQTTFCKSGVHTMNFQTYLNCVDP